MTWWSASSWQPTGFIGIDGIETSAGLRLVFGFSAAVASLGGENYCEVRGTGLLGGSGAVDVTSGILKDTGLLLEHTDPLLLLRCLLFILKIRPSSFLTSFMIL